ncbi:winged helix-turn-helix domain-containing protein [Thermogemmata fonticola]|jgi:DNA-binding response OmpR family regulator|uniref:Winged helix-turn-helix transcriptional regulator n=1 Tax=Thermogemmata fonticola TaxID=2755323 RepID=A0A7V9AC22_9BACT|nr:winged helix-turn-helix domain-containing protein [Thermogemmata fonticola]MBA2226613.1 winged helix-turn-helix transcriptional regulator [Thermogemmata fonticola]
MGKLLVIAPAGKERQQLVRWLEHLGHAAVPATLRDLEPELLRRVDLVLASTRLLLNTDWSRWPRGIACPQLWLLDAPLPPQQLRELLAPLQPVRWGYLATPFTRAELAAALAALLQPDSAAPPAAASPASASAPPPSPTPAGARPAPPLPGAAAALAPPAAGPLRVHDCLVNLEQRCIHRPDGTCIRLSEMEAAILRYLLTHRSRVISREELLRQVWGIPAEGLTTRTVDMHIARLRAKLRPADSDPASAPAIVTIRKRGYQVGPAWCEPPAPAL